MSAEGLTQTVLATQLLEAVRADIEAGRPPIDLTNGVGKIRRGKLADWIRGIAKLLQLAPPPPAWTEDPPTEPGFYWLYGEEAYGSMGGHYSGTIPPETRLHYVEVMEIRNGLAAVTSGRFMSLDKFNPAKRREGHIGVWQPVQLPALPI